MSVAESLPIVQVESCEGCGACCMAQGSPPGYIGLIPGHESGLSRDEWPDREDIERVDTMPREAVKILLRYRAQLLRGEVSGEGPCVWLNQQTKECRFYEFRPQICRDFERGCGGCLEWRAEFIQHK